MNWHQNILTRPFIRVVSRAKLCSVAAQFSTPSSLYFSEVRPDLKTIVDVWGTEITAIIAHPPPPKPHWRGLKFDRQTWKQISSLAELAIKHQPAVLVGDFNLVDWWERICPYALLRIEGCLSSCRAGQRTHPAQAHRTLETHASPQPLAEQADLFPDAARGLHLVYRTAALP